MGPAGPENGSTSSRGNSRSTCRLWPCRDRRSSSPACRTRISASFQVWRTATSFPARAVPNRTPVRVRPPVNAIDGRTSMELYRALRDDSLMVGIVTGVGERCFPAGWDLKAVVAADSLAEVDGEDSVGVSRASPGSGIFASRSGVDAEPCPAPRPRLWSAPLRRGAGVVERGGLENRCAPCVPRVRIPPSPPVTQ